MSSLTVAPTRPPRSAPRRPLRPSPCVLVAACGSSTAPPSPPLAPTPAADAPPPPAVAPTPVASADAADRLRPDRGAGRGDPRPPAEGSRSSRTIVDDAELRANLTAAVRRGQPAGRTRRQRAALQGARPAAGRTVNLRRPLPRPPGEPGRRLYVPTTRQLFVVSQVGRRRAAREVHLRPRVHPRAPGPELRPPGVPARRRSRTSATRRSPAWRSSRATPRC